MKLQDIKSHEEFKDYYKFWNLNTYQEKKEWLWKCMGIILHTGDNLTEDEEIKILEEHALLGWDGKQTKFEKKQLKKLIKK